MKKHRLNIDSFFQEGAGIKCRFLLVLLISCFFSLSGWSLRNKLQVIDSISGEPLPLATLSTVKGKKQAFVADTLGIVTLPLNLDRRDFKVMYAGYEPGYFHFSVNDTVRSISLSPITYDLEEIFIKPTKERYSKKNNPAVDFVNRLRKLSHNHNPADTTFYSYDKYEKTLIALNNYRGDFSKGLMKRQGKFMQEYVDTSSVTGARLLDLILKEKSATRIVSNNPKADKEVTWGYRAVGLDEMFNADNIRVLLEDVIREIDVYEPNITLMQNRFVSPLSPIGPDFYKYYLTDTVYIGSEKCIELTFVPHNTQSMGFNGKIYVPVEDTTMFVKKITMRTPHDINLNFLKNLYINQSFTKDSVGNRHKTYDDVLIEMQIVAGTPEFYGRKTSFYDNFSYDRRDDLKDYYHKLGTDFNITDSIGQTAEFWNEKRMVPLSPVEESMGEMTTTMRKIPLFYWGEKFIRLMESGYVTTGNPSKFDFGPLNTILSFGSVEGVRIRLGGMTMAALNPHLFLSGYVAYGTKDRRWKYSGKIEYSFPRKKRYSYEWPRHGFYMSYRHDIDKVGQEYLYTNQDNIFLSLTRKSSNLATYKTTAKAGYVLELRNNFSLEAGGKFTRQESTPWLQFILPSGKVLPNYRQASFNISLRWAKGEKFIQGRSHRLPVNMDPWIFQIIHEFGPKGLFGAAYTTNLTELTIQKRFWLSAFGYIDLIAKAGKIWSSVYYPDLMWPNANLSYTIQQGSYSLLDPMEFANDSYGALHFNYFGNGVLFNRIPGINRLKLREVLTFKGLMGTLSHRNDPRYNKDIISFPDDALAQKMKKTPYMEVGVGIDNILSVLRVDYVWRLTYRNTPGVDKSGVRISFHFTL